MALLGHEEDAVEAEPVLIEGGVESVTLTLDDGTEVTFDRDELMAALIDVAADEMPGGWAQAA